MPCCYIIQCGDTPIVKIGWTAATAEIRILSLQTAHHEELRTLRVIAGNREIETWMHRRFKQHHVRNDWYRLVPEMLTISVEELRPPEPKMPVERRAAHSDAIRESLRKKRPALISWAADMCSRQKPCAWCRKTKPFWLGNAPPMELDRQAVRPNAAR